MPKLDEIQFDELKLDVFKIWKDSFLLTSGNSSHFNSMTIGWGSLGIMWHVPIVMVGVRPTRYTYEFMEKYDSFTICGFAPEYKTALNIMGSKSGRDIDKVKETGLTPCESSSIETPGFAEASIIIECRKIYSDDLNKEKCSQLILDFYKDREYHRLYIGQILKVFGDKKVICN